VGLSDVLRISRDRYLDVGETLDAGNEIGGVAITSGMRGIPLAEPAEGVPAQGHDVAHASRAIIADHGVDLLARGGDAGQMRSGGESGFGQNAFDGGMRSLARGAAGAVGD